MSIHTQNRYSQNPHPWLQVLFPKHGHEVSDGSTLKLKTTPRKPKGQEGRGWKWCPWSRRYATWDWSSQPLLRVLLHLGSSLSIPSALSFLHPSFQRHHGVSLRWAEGWTGRLILAFCFPLPPQSHFHTRIFWGLHSRACRESEGWLFGVLGEVLGDPQVCRFGEVGGPAKGRTLARGRTAWFCPKGLGCKYIPTEFRTPSLPHCRSPFRLQ